MKTYFSEGKIMKRFGNPLLLRGPCPLSTKPPISEQFFHDRPLCPNFKNKKPSLILGWGGVNYGLTTSIPALCKITRIKL